MRQDEFYLKQSRDSELICRAIESGVIAVLISATNVIVFQENIHIHNALYFKCNVI
jgi:hypothetical protein